MTKLTHKCDWCGKEFYIAPFRLKAKTICCSRECAASLAKENRNNCICPVCGKRFHSKSSHIAKTGHKVCCSKECGVKYRSEWFSGEGNHQYGLKGDKNSSWKSDRRISRFGYVLIRSLDHPFRDCDDFMFEHRLVAEKYLLTDENSVKIDGKRYLSKDYVVHHKDHNRQNNNVENLVVLRKEDHVELHAEERRADSYSRVRTCEKCGDSYIRLDKKWKNLCEDCYCDMLEERRKYK